LKLCNEFRIKFTVDLRYFIIEIDSELTDLFKKIGIAGSSANFSAFAQIMGNIGLIVVGFGQKTKILPEFSLPV
jgi:hypothetical protein